MEKKELKRKYHRFFWGQRQKAGKNSITTIVRLPFWFLISDWQQRAEQQNTHAYLIEDFRYAHIYIYIYAYLWVYIAGDKPLNDDIGQPSGRQKKRRQDKPNVPRNAEQPAKAIGLSGNRSIDPVRRWEVVSLSTVDSLRGALSDMLNDCPWVAPCPTTLPRLKLKICVFLPLCRLYFTMVTSRACPHYPSLTEWEEFVYLLLCRSFTTVGTSCPCTSTIRLFNLLSRTVRPYRLSNLTDCRI